MEFSKVKKEDDNENSEKKSQDTNWALIFSQMLKHYPGLTINDLLDMSYPQFKALYSIVFDPRTFSVTIPYMGSGDKNKDKTNEIKQEENEVTTKEGLLQMIARANSGWK